MKIILIICSILAFSECQKISLCSMPEDISASRRDRFQHACESNQHDEFAIEVHERFFCVFYSSHLIALFGAKTKIEIKFGDERWNYEQVWN